MADLPDFAEALAQAEAAIEVLDLHAYDDAGARATSAVWLRGELYMRSRHVVALHAAWEAATTERDRAMDAAEKAIERGNEAATGWHASMDERARLAGRVTALRGLLLRAAAWVKHDVEHSLHPNEVGLGEALLAAIREALAGLDEPPEPDAPVPGAGGEA